MTTVAQGTTTPPRGLAEELVNDKSFCISVITHLSVSSGPREIFHGGVKTGLVERSCNLSRRKICGSEEQICISTVIICFNVS